jgi:hypothetical protein
MRQFEYGPNEASCLIKSLRRGCGSFHEERLRDFGVALSGAERNSPVNKPSIMSIVVEHVRLRRSGKEYVGLCPFHSDKNPSFSVNEDKGVFHCFGCGESGDVVDFIMKLDGLSFRDAWRALGIDNAVAHREPRARPNRKAAALPAGWLNQQQLLVGARLRELSRQIALADEIPDIELKENLEREWEILSDLHADLQRPEYAAELFRAKDSIERITEFAPAEPLLEFPEFTPEYWAFLRAHLPTTEKPEAPC